MLNPADFLEKWMLEQRIKDFDPQRRSQIIDLYERNKAKELTGNELPSKVTSEGMMNDPYVANSALPNNVNSIANATPEMAGLLNVLSNQKNADEMQSILRGEYASKVRLGNQQELFNTVVDPTNRLQVNSTLALANMNNNTFLRGKQIDNEGLMAIASAIGGRSSLADALIARMPEAPRP